MTNGIHLVLAEKCHPMDTGNLFESDEEEELKIFQGIFNAQEVAIHPTIYYSTVNEVFKEATQH